MRPFILVLIACSLVLPAVHALEVGDKAPPLEVTKWLHGEGVNPAGDTDKVCVVEFWATWCGPCRVTIPHLNKLHEQYGDKVVIMGISREAEATVAGFMKDNQMNYNVAVATEAQTNAYMEGVPGIPHAFIVDRDGKVAWAGHPMGMDRVLAAVVAGHYDPAKQAKISALQKQLQMSLQQRPPKTADVLQTLGGLIELDPGNPEWHSLKVRVLAYDEAESDQLMAAYRQWFEKAGDDPESLAALAEQLINAEDLETRDLELAHEAASRAVKAAPDNPAAAMALADVYTAIGMQEEAIDTLEKAVEKQDKEREEAQRMRRVIDHMKRAARLRGQLRK